MATTEELILRVKYDIQKGGIAFAADELKKYSESTKAADGAVKQMEKSIMSANSKFDAQQKRLNNVRDSIAKSQLAFAGLTQTLGGVPGQILEVTNQIEQFEYVAKRNGQSINLFSASVGQATGAIGKLGVAGLVVASAIGGWKIGTWIANQEVFGKKIGQTTDYLMDLSSMAKEDEDRLRAMNDRLAESLWEKYGIQVKLAGMNVLEANKALLAAASAANQAHIAIASALKEINKNAAQLSNEFILNQMSPADRIVEIERQIGEKRLALQKSVSPKYIEQYKKEIEQLQQLQMSASSEYLSEEKQKNEEALREQKKAAEERKRIEEQMAKEIAKFREKDHLDFLKRQQEQADASTKALRDRMHEEVEALKHLQEINVQITLDEIAQAEFETAEAIKGTNERIKEQNDALEILVAKLQLFAGIMAQVGGIAGDAGSAFLSGFSYAIEQGANKLQASLFGIGGAFQSLAQNIGGSVGEILNAVGTLAQAFAEGGIVGAIVAGATILANKLIELFKHDWKADTKNIIEGIHGITGVSKELQEQIAKLAEEIGDADTAFILSLNDIIDEVGITAETMQGLHDVFSFLERGQITAAQAADILNEAWDELAEASTDSFGLINDKMKELIALSQQFGLEIPAITEFLNQQAEALAGTFDSLISGISDKAGAQGIADILKQTFQALGGGPEALAQLSGAIDAIKAKLKEMGLTMADVGLGFLNQLNQIGKKFPEFAQSISAVNTELVSLSNMGLLTANSFKTLQDQAIAAFNKINKDGKVSKAELASMMPTLQLLAKLALQYGYALDPATIALLKQAGLWDDVANKPKVAGDATQDAMTRAADAMERVADALEKVVGGFTDAASGAMGLAAAVDSIPTDLTIGVNFDVGETPTFDANGDGSVRKRAGLRGMEVVDNASQMYLLHRGEGILGKDVMQQLSKGNGMATTINLGNGAIQINGSGLNQSQLTQAIIDAFRKGLIKGYKV